MKTWMYHLAVASAVVLAVIGLSAWLVHAGLPAISSSEPLAGSPVLSVLRLTFGLIP